MPRNSMKLKGVASARNDKSKNLVVAKMMKSCCEHLAETIAGAIVNQNQSRPSSAIDLKEFKKVI
ncbi:hypothetical protein MKX03_030618, partial [Papaver bracteatum]